MAFKPVRYDSGKTLKQTMDNTAVTYTKFSALCVDTDGFVVNATKKSGPAAGRAKVARYVSLEDAVTASDSTGSILVMDVRGVQFDASIDTSPTQSYIGSEVNFTDCTGLASDNDTPAFYIQDIIDSKTVRGYFLDATG